MVLNDHKAPGVQPAALDPAAQPLYPVGYRTTFLPADPARRKWALKADPATNTWQSDVPVTGPVRVNAAGKFELAD